MVLKEHEDMKIVEIWFTKQEQEDEALHQTLQKLYQDYSRRKFKVAQSHSGAGSLYDATRHKLLFNRRRLPEIENRREKSLEKPNLSAGYSSSFPIQRRLPKDR